MHEQPASYVSGLVLQRDELMIPAVHISFSQAAHCIRVATDAGRHAASTGRVPHALKDVTFVCLFV
jgi:hypothetical protein